VGRSRISEQRHNIFFCLLITANSAVTLFFITERPRIEYSIMNVDPFEGKNRLSRKTKWLQSDLFILGDTHDAGLSPEHATSLKIKKLIN